MCFDAGLYIQPDIIFCCQSSHTFSYSTNVALSFLVDLSSPTDSSNCLDPSFGSPWKLCWDCVFLMVWARYEIQDCLPSCHTNKHCRKAPLPPFPASFPPFPSLPAKECRMKYWWNAHSLGHVSIHSCQTHPISMCLDVYVSMRATVQMRTREGERERGGHKLDYGTIACSGSVSSLATVAFDLFFPKAFAFALWFLKSFQVSRLAVTAAPWQAQLHQLEAEVAGRLCNFTNVSRSGTSSLDGGSACIWIIWQSKHLLHRVIWKLLCFATMIPPEGIGWAAWERNLWAGQSCSFDHI